MAHALKRISYATCDPDFCQFSFLAREPKANLSMQFCHAFMTSSKEEVREWPVAVSCINLYFDLPLLIAIGQNADTFEFFDF